MTDRTKQMKDEETLKIVVSKIEIEIPREKKEFLAYVSIFVLEVMELATEVYDQKQLLTSALQLCAMEAADAFLKDKYFEGIIWEGAIGSFLKQFSSLKDGSYDPFAFLKLNFAEEISDYIKKLTNYDLHIPEV